MTRRPGGGALPTLALALLAAAAAGACWGSVPVPLVAVVQSLLPNAPHDAEWRTILWELRFPRVCGAALVGAALGTVGTLYQGLLRNPLADPYVLGTSGGAALGAVLGMLVVTPLQWLGFGPVPILAFVGALGSTAAVMGLAGGGSRRLPLVPLLLAGFAVSTLLGYSVSLLLVVSERYQLEMPRLYGWLLGGISLTGWTQLAVVAPLMLIGMMLAGGQAAALNALSLGEESAGTVGISVEAVKRTILALGALLTALAVSISGLVGFVGLVVPHLLRLWLGPDHRRLLPASGLGGAGFLVICDLLARVTLAPQELPLGLVTALVGGPFFLWLLRRSREVTG